MTLQNVQEEVMLDSLSEEYFSLNESEAMAKRCLLKYEKENVLIKGDYVDNLWVFEHHLDKGTFVYFDFNLINSVDDNLPNNFVSIVKCWIADLLTKYYPNSVKGYVKYLYDGLRQSNGFHINKVAELIQWIKNKPVVDNTREDIVICILNFLDYADLEINDSYVPKLLEYKKSLKITKKVRTLPPSSEVLKFSYYLNDFFGSIKFDRFDKQNKKIHQLYVLYCPILIWWRLTNIIPLRVTEFCTITRQCLTTEGKEHYIQLPRIKDKYNSKRIQVVDRINISTEMYELINDYIINTNVYGKTKTLISYRSIAEASNTNKGYLKNEMDYFSKGILYSLIDKFYKDVLIGKYNLAIETEHYLKPNDTRHLAFTSLMLQGISPVEIARLGGHRTISAQYHYQFHLEYWVDSEVFKLMKHRNKFMRNRLLSNNTETEINFIPNEVLLKAYLPASTDILIKLDIGYCIDEFQRCPTEECLACENWRISPEELIEKRMKIKEKIARSRRKIDELAAFIHNIHKIILADEIARINTSTFNELNTHVNSIKDEVHVLTRLLSIPQIEE